MLLPETAGFLEKDQEPLSLLALIHSYSSFVQIVYHKVEVAKVRGNGGSLTPRTIILDLTPAVGSDEKEERRDDPVRDGDLSSEK